MSLIERLEAAEVGSRELDCLLAREFGWHRVEPRFARNKHGAWIAPEDFMGVQSDGSPRLDSLHGTTMHRDPYRFTTSLDAALALAERVLPGWHWELDNVGGSPYAANLTNPVGRFLICGDTEVYSTAPTTALALCIAILKAKETK